jgi:hypothetical protein
MQSAPPALPQIACDTVNIIFSTQHRHAKNLSTRFAASRGILRRDVVASAETTTSQQSTSQQSSQQSTIIKNQINI